MTAVFDGHNDALGKPQQADDVPERFLRARCAQLRIALDVSYLTAAGFADVARLDAAPVIASPSACHALCPTSRNPTDGQLRERRDSRCRLRRPLHPGRRR